MAQVRMRIVWVIDSMDKLSEFGEEAQLQLGRDLERVQNGVRPLDFGPLAPALPGVFELRDEDAAFWYRLLYTQIGGQIYVLDCVKKKSNELSKPDVERARKRLGACPRIHLKFC